MAKKEEKVVEEIQPTEAKVVEQPNQTEEVVKEGGDMKMKAPKTVSYTHLTLPTKRIV